MRVTAFCAALVLLTVGTTYGLQTQFKTCALKGDPHYRSYSGLMHASAPFPCIFLVTKTDRMPLGPNFEVEVSVYAAAGMDTGNNGGYFIDWVLVVVDGYRASDGNARGQMNFTSNTASVLSAMTNSDSSLAWVASGAFTGPGPSTQPTVVNDVPDLPTTQLMFFNPGGFMWMRIIFTARLHNNKTDICYGLTITLHQAQRPPANYIFPTSLCSTFADNNWNNDIITFGTYTDTILFGLFGQDNTQTAAQCSIAFNLFHNICPDDVARRHAISNCSFLLERKNARCIEHKAVGAALGDAFRAFINCMAWLCGGVVDADWAADLSVRHTTC